MAPRAASRSRSLTQASDGVRGGAAVAAVVSVVAGLVAVAGVVVVMARSDPGSHAGHEQQVYSAGGMELTVNRWQWMSHDMFGGPTPVQNNFPMPAQMMPGMAAADVNRLHVELTITNGTQEPAQVSGQNFLLEAPDGQQFKVNDTSDGSGRPVQLGVRTSTTMDLYFDVPLKESVRDLVFTTVGRSVRIPFSGAAPQHQHGY